MKGQALRRVVCSAEDTNENSKLAIKGYGCTNRKQKLSNTKISIEMLKCFNLS